MEKRNGDGRTGGKVVPFGIDRAQRANLADQIADGFSQAISAGFYRPGDRLPTVRELVRRFGVSSRDVVAAVAMLAEKGLVESVPRKGLTVRERSAMPVWKGHVLCVVASGDFSYSVLSMVGRVRATVSAAGYLFTQVTVPRNIRGCLELGGLDFALNQPIDFAVVTSFDRGILARLEKKGIPFVAESAGEGRPPSCCRAVYRYDVESAFAGIASYCAGHSITRAVVVSKDAERSPAVSLLSSAGLAVEVKDASKPMRLVFGSVDGDPVAMLNGQLLFDRHPVTDRRVAWKTAFGTDVAGKLVEGRNELVISISKSDGGRGLLRPVFLDYVPR